jgi:hypothetical protein
MVVFNQFERLIWAGTTDANRPFNFLQVFSPATIFGGMEQSS